MSLEEILMPKELTTWERGGETALLDGRGLFVEANPAMQLLLDGCKELRELIHPEDWQDLRPGRRRVRMRQGGQAFDLSLAALDEGWLLQLHPLQDPGPTREFFHQVKNHLAVVSSLLQMQSSLGQSASQKQAFADCQTRVHCLALLYGQVHPLRGDLDFAVHLGELLGLLLEGRSLAGGDLQLEPVILLLEQAVPLSLIAHELISNSLRHARAVGLRIRLEGGQQVRLTVADRGAGLPAEIEPARANSLGLRLVRTLSRQLRAEVTWGPGPGASCGLSFAPKGAA